MSVSALSMFQKSSDELSMEANAETNPKAKINSEKLTTKKMDVEKELSSTDLLEFGRHFEKGQEFKRCDNIQEAIDCYQTALKLNPSSGWAHHCIAQAYVEIGGFEKAIDHYKLALAFLPEEKNTQTLLQLGRTYVYADKMEEAWLCITAIRDKNQQENEKFISTEVLIPLAGRIQWIIDADWYCSTNAFEPQLDERIDKFISVALDYFGPDSSIAKKSLHWIIDDTYILSQLAKSVRYDINVPAVLLFIDSLVNGKFVAPHWIIKKENRSALAKKEKSPLETMWMLAEMHFNNPDYFNILFDSNYYCSQLSESVSNPVRHYITNGAMLSIDPHPVFHASYYKRCADLEKSSDAVRHYLVQHGHERFTPNPAFVFQYYKRKYSSTEFWSKSPIEHFLQANDKKHSIRCFDAHNYNISYKDIRENKIEPEYHFLVYGIRESHRVPFKGFSQSYVRYKARYCRVYYKTASATYYGEQWYKHKNIVVVSHSACRTGAPLIALRLVNELAKVPSFEVTVILLKDGPLANEFTKFSHVVTLKNEWGSDREENKAVLESFIGRKPYLCICNSAESRNVGRSLHAAGFPVVSLVHEMADHYKTPKIWGEIFDVSDRVIFPSRFVKARSDLMLAGYRDKAEYDASVLPQGLLTKNFARYDSTDARARVRKKLDIDDKEIVVLACGTLDLRKGIDVFLRCAVMTLKMKKNVNFIWLGGEKPGTDNQDHFFWALKDIDMSLRKRIMHVSCIDDVEPYFQAADIFLLTSRSDPFPCVMHEALAAGLPIVYMDDSGGVAELVGTECGVPCPYEDVNALTESIIELSTDGKHRIELGNIGKEIIQSQYDFTDYVNDLLDLSINRNGGFSEQTEECRKENSIYEKVPKNQEADVYFLNSDWGVSGVNSLTEELVVELNSRGLNSRVLFTQGNTLSEEETNNLSPELPFEYLHVDMDLEYPANVHKAVLQYFKHHKPCVLITNYDYTVSEISSKFPAHIGVLGVVHSDDCEHYQHVNMQGHHWNKIIAVSEKILERVATLNPGFIPRMVCIKNGVKVDLSCTGEVLERIEKSEGIRLVYAGRLEHYQKRMDRYIELINALEARNINYKYDFIGTGSQEKMMISALSGQIESGNVVFHGRLERPEALEIMKDSDVMVLLSDFEGMPMCLLEAISCGCIPIVKSMDGGIVDYITHGKNGFVCETVESTVDALEILCDGNTTKVMKEESKAILKSNGLTMDRMVDEYVAAIRSTLVEAGAESFQRPRWIAGA